MYNSTIVHVQYYMSYTTCTCYCTTCTCTVVYLVTDERDDVGSRRSGEVTGRGERVREGGMRAYRLQEEEVARLLTGVTEMRRKEERSKQGQTNNKAKQHSTPKAFPKKNELPRVGLEPTTLRITQSPADLSLRCHCRCVATVLISAVETLSTTRSGTTRLP